MHNFTWSTDVFSSADIKHSRCAVTVIPNRAYAITSREFTESRCSWSTFFSVSHLHDLLILSVAISGNATSEWPSLKASWLSWFFKNRLNINKLIIIIIIIIINNNNNNVPYYQKSPLFSFYYENVMHILIKNPISATVDENISYWLILKTSMNL